MPARSDTKRYADTGDVVHAGSHEPDVCPYRHRRDVSPATPHDLAVAAMRPVPGRQDGRPWGSVRNSTSDSSASGCCFGNDEALAEEGLDAKGMVFWGQAREAEVDPLVVQLLHLLVRFRILQMEVDLREACTEPARHRREHVWPASSGFERRPVGCGGRFMEGGVPVERKPNCSPALGARWASGYAAAGSEREDGMIAYRADRVIDAAHDRPIENGVVVVADGRVVSVGASPDLAVDADLVTISKGTSGAGGGTR